MKTEVLPTHSPQLFQEAVYRAAELLRTGQVVALPTETVYGLAANALSESAVAGIFEAKGRPPNNPVIVHVADVAWARRCASDWTAEADRLAAAFWPGPLTLVVPRGEKIPDKATAGGATVGLRQPRHPFIQAVIRTCDFPLAAPSANLSSQISPTHVDHVLRQLGGRIPLVVDGGPCQVGIESTVVDLTESPPRILRPGMIHDVSLAAVLGNIQPPARNLPHSMLRSPGLLQKHYAPQAKLMLLNWRDDADLKSQISDLEFETSQAHVIAYDRIPSAVGWGQVSVIPHDPEAFARALYAELHRCDEAGAELIVAEAPPETPEWQAITDRLHRAAA